MKNERNEDRMFQASECKQLILTYNSLARQIAVLLLANGGGTANMSDEVVAFYRSLSGRRDLARYMIQVIQPQLLDNEAVSAG